MGGSSAHGPEGTPSSSRQRPREGPLRPIECRRPRGVSPKGIGPTAPFVSRHHLANAWEQQRAWRTDIPSALHASRQRSKALTLSRLSILSLSRSTMNCAGSSRLLSRSSAKTRADTVSTAGRARAPAREGQGGGGGAQTVALVASRRHGNEILGGEELQHVAVVDRVPARHPRTPPVEPGEGRRAHAGWAGGVRQTRARRAHALTGTSQSPRRAFPACWSGMASPSWPRSAALVPPPLPAVGRSPVESCPFLQPFF